MQTRLTEKQYDDIPLQNHQHQLKQIYPLAKKKNNEEKIFSSDREFNQLYPQTIQLLAQNHWTPLLVAKKAAEFLATNKGSRVLDIGSGVGKFCLAAAHYKPHSFFYGVEQRETLIAHAETVKQQLAYANANFIHGNFTKIDFKQYDHFYFYNSFYENVYGTQKIDSSLEYNGELYEYYTHHLHRQLSKMPEGTKMATYHVLEDEMFAGFHIVGTDSDNLLKFWEKI